MDWRHALPVGDVIFAGWPFRDWIEKRAANAAVRARTEALVDKNPQLKPAWTIA
jgi:hypothetical protein